MIDVDKRQNKTKEKAVNPEEFKKKKSVCRMEESKQIKITE